MDRAHAAAVLLPITPCGICASPTCVPWWEPVNVLMLIGGAVLWKTLIKAAAKNRRLKLQFTRAQLGIFYIIIIIIFFNRCLVSIIVMLVVYIFLPHFGSIDTYCFQFTYASTSISSFPLPQPFITLLLLICLIFSVSCLFHLFT